MARISRNKVNEEILMRIYDLFFTVMTRSNTKDAFFKTIDEMLSPTEKIMIAKRLAIIFLLMKKIDQKIISRVLKVSTSTVAIYSHLFFKRNSELVRMINNMINKERALDFLEDVIHNLITHPGIYIGHWQRHWRHKKRRQRKETTGF